MSPVDLIQELRDKHDAWQRQCDGWIANAESLGGGIDAATIERMRRTVYGEAADSLASKDAALAEIRAENERRKEWQDAIIGLCKAIGSDDMPWGGDKAGWGFIFYFVKHLHTRATAAESELARVKKAMEPFAVKLGKNYDEVADSVPFTAYFSVGQIRAASRALSQDVEERA